MAKELPEDSMKPYKEGVIIGKFYPPHNGHHYLIDEALSLCEVVNVLLCVAPEQTVPALVRLACLREVHPTANILVTQDDLPENSSLWAKRTIEILGHSPEVVFSSEEYGDRYASYMGAKHVLVDLARTKVPCSGTLIRKDPLNNLDFLSPYMRAYYTKKVCILGAESTGTTTLAKALGEYYNTTWIPEYGRDYVVEKWKDGYTDVWTSDEFVHIAGTQTKHILEAARKANKVVITDTDAFATWLWHKRYMGTWEERVLEIANLNPCDLYILTDDDIPFVQDGTRDGEAIRHSMHQDFVNMLDKENKHWILVSGTREERMAQSIKLIDKLTS